MSDLNSPRSATERAELLFLRIFKVALVIFMGLALLAALLLLAISLYNLGQSPKEPKPAAPAPKQEVSVDKLLKQLDPPKQETPKPEEKSPPQPAGPSVLKYNEEATKLYRCSLDFSRAVGLTVEENDSAAAQEAVKELRTQIENIADAESTRGEPYAKDSAEFTCAALKAPAIIRLRKEKNVTGIFYKTVNFHLREWDRIQTEAKRFEEAEKKRVAEERAMEELRVAEARAFAITALIAAAGAFGVFMLLALYLILSKIEGNLRPLSSLNETSPKEST